MTVRELTNKLLRFNEEDLDREVIIFDGPSYFTPYKVEVLSIKEGWSKNIDGKVLID